MANKAKEDSDLSVCLQEWILGNGLQICSARLNTLFRHLMGQIVYPLLKEDALQWFQFQIVLSKLVKYDMQLVQVLFCHSWEHN